MKHVLRFAWFLVKPWLEAAAIIPMLFVGAVLGIGYLICTAWIMSGSDEKLKRDW